MHICIYLILFYIPFEMGKEKTNRKKESSTIGWWSRASKATGQRITRSFLPKKLVCPQLVPFPLGIKGCQLKTMSPGSDSTFLLSAIYLPFSVTQSVAISFLRASLGNRGWWVKGGSKWDPMPSGTSVTQDNGCWLGTVVSVVLSYMQRARGSSMYPYHLQFLIFVTSHMYVWVE